MRGLEASSSQSHLTSSQPFSEPISMFNSAFEPLWSRSTSLKASTSPLCRLYTTKRSIGDSSTVTSARPRKLGNPVRLLQMLSSRFATTARKAFHLLPRKSAYNDQTFAALLAVGSRLLDLEGYERLRLERRFEQDEKASGKADGAIEVAERMSP